jgi:cytochrome c
MSELKITFKVDGNHVVIEDDVMGKRSFDQHDEVALVKDQLQYLQIQMMLRVQARAPVTEHLRKDIATYVYILGNENPRERAREYFLTKQSMKDEGKSPFNYQVAEELQWKIRA